MSIYICKICHKSLKSFCSLTHHVRTNHNIKNLRIDYFKIYDDSVFSNCIICDKKVYSKYKTDKQHSKTCSRECHIISISNKKQSKEQIEKRIKNTNQHLKEQNRQNTMLQKYGKLYFCENPDEISKKLSIANKNRKHTKEHHLKVIETKRKNGNLNHSEETKNKIKTKLLKLYQSDDPPITIPKGSNKKHKQGKIENLFYRSSYEKKFIEYCLTNNIKIESAETKEFRVPYIFEDKQKYYYPDFYLPEYDLVVEIKAEYKLTDEQTQCKIQACMKRHAMILICEEELENLDEYFLYLNMPI